MGRPAAYLKDVAATAQSLAYWLNKGDQPLHRRYLARRRRDAQRSYHAHPTLRPFLSAVDASRVNSRHDLACWRRQVRTKAAYDVHRLLPGPTVLQLSPCGAATGRLHLRQVAVLSGSVACMQSPHQRFRSDALAYWSAEDSQNHGALARHPRPMRTAD